MRSAQLAMATLQLLSSTLDALDIDVAAMWHRCGYCEELRPPVQTALEELEKYLAKSPVATQRALEGLKGENFGREEWIGLKCVLKYGLQ